MAQHTSSFVRPLESPGCSTPRRIASKRGLLDKIGDSEHWVLLVFNIQDHYLLTNLYGRTLVAQLEERLGDSLLHAAREEACQDQAVLFQSNPGELLLLWPLLSKDTSRLADLTYAIKLKVQNDLKQLMLQRTGREVELGIGFSTLKTKRSTSPANAFLHAVNEARTAAHCQIVISQLDLAHDFRDIIERGDIRIHYQPIMDFQNGNVFGWEALARGPKGSPFRSPVMLFEMAEKLERLFRLEEICREKAISGLGAIVSGQKLFLNIHPKTMADPNFTPGKTLQLLEEAGLTPENVIFEITERHSIQNFDLFYRTLAHYRSQGFLVAVDDAGAGYSGLTSIAEIRPDFIKIDKNLVMDVDRDPVKRALIETFVSFANKIGSRILAEGIETKGQTTCLVDMGVHFGQGFYLARPGSPRPELAIDPQTIKPLTDLSKETFSCSIPVGKLAEPPHPVNQDFLTCEARSFFEENRHISNLVVEDDGRPLGLVMEYHLNRQLTTQYGMALFFNRPVTNVMDSAPLVVDERTPVEQAAKLAMERPTLKAYDDIIITRHKKLFGVITVQRLMNTLAQVQVEMAKGTNPLSGLPGNVAVEKELESRIRSGETFDIIYADLDNFKVYNDTYGFKNGDMIIKLAADILSWATKRHGQAGSKLCHIGGDDFVIITPPEKSERICRGTVRCFSRLVRNCYCVEDRDRGWIKATGRDGRQREYPLVSISLGIISIEGPTSFKEISERAAGIKKYAKSIPGNAYVRDRRDSPPLETKPPRLPLKTSKSHIPVP
ncbi:diguanylate cyclase (GGDEF) domain-containing protein [Paucidesulfovibrio gracilis DSM 16080]|uniref:Diguanylate cyclase (GGDEF) domain-containing protein n=1 Tax=Paucidesulfovibrio gracilis DSM 16080 TaxID=1121449 RepID=A0A1T4WIQ5_9BACT|nr:GGDEF domain-containing protein [Paucidesulfovibrio gracilis]SKA77039.1 diguanylate cyclase (GGDEF) domain-containing protein [Paucidesulfovibrio gracilis DSM 16080]